MYPLKDRQMAGQELATHLTHYKEQPNTIVLALPRGGVPVAYEISQKLHLPLDIFLVRKLGVPGHEELAMGAVADGNVMVLNDELINELQISREEILGISVKEKKELKRRNQLYRKGKPLPDLFHRQIILVDDGIATGSTMKAAIIALKALKPSRIIIAAPVASPHSLAMLEPLVDEIQCVIVPPQLNSIGEWYQHFPQTSDNEVCSILNGSN